MQDQNMVLKNDNDVIFNSFWLKKFTNKLGFKSLIFYKLVKLIKYNHRYEAIFLFFEIIEIIKPMLFTISRKRGKRLFEIPIILTSREQYVKSILWLASNIQTQKEKKLGSKLYFGFLDILKKKSVIYLLTQKLNKKVILNRAFQRFKWK